jgi:hypothetical protein
MAGQVVGVSVPLSARLGQAYRVCVVRLGRNVAQAAEQPERIFNIRPSHDMRREGTDAEVPVSWHSAFKTAKKTKLNIKQHHIKSGEIIATHEKRPNKHTSKGKTNAF